MKAEKKIKKAGFEMVAIMVLRYGNIQQGGYSYRLNGRELFKETSTVRALRRLKLTYPNRFKIAEYLI